MTSRIAGAVVAVLFSALLVTATATPAAAVDTASVSGTVLRAQDNAPLGGAYVSLRVNGAHTYVQALYANSSGAFTFTGLPAGNYTLFYGSPVADQRYIAEWYPNSRAESGTLMFTVAAGQAKVVDTVTLGLGVQIYGNVKGEKASGNINLAGVSVRVFKDGVIYKQVNTDIDGNYALEGLVGGTYTLKFETSGTYASQWYPGGSSISRAQTSTYAEVTQYTKDALLKYASTISGTLKNAAGGNLTGTVLVYDADGTANQSSAALVKFQGASGTWSVSGLGPGLYRLAFTTATPGYTATGPQPSGNGYITEWWNSEYAVGSSDYVVVPFSGAAEALTGYDVVLENPVFADVQDPTSSFYTAIEWMYSENISTGTPQGGGLKPLYKPADTVTRQSMATFLYRLSGDVYVPSATPTFADVPADASTYAAVEWMAHNGISTGTPQPSGKPLFNPAAVVSRQSMAVFLARMAEVDTDAPTSTQVFADVPTTASTATAIEWMYDTGISTGTPQPSGLPLYKPSDPVSRQAMALFLYRFAHNI